MTEFDEQFAVCAAYAKSVAESVEDERWYFDMNVAAQLGDMYVLQHILPEETMTTNSRGWSPVMYASAAEHCKVLTYLLDTAQQCGFGNEARKQAIDTVVHYDNLVMFTFLKENEAVTTTDLNTSLLTAVALGNRNMTKILLDNGADVNFKNEEGATPLALALEYGDMNLTSLLVSATMDTNKRAPRNVLEKKEFGDIASFCSNLTINIDTYKSEETLHQFLLSMDLAGEWSVFQREEVDFGVFLHMTNNDLQLIGITNADNRRAILEGKSYVISYFEQLFGQNITAKLFKC